jgi:jumonji domain-containing protein 7
MFVKPWEEQQSFEEFVDFVSKQELSKVPVESVTEVRYAQTREFHVLDPLPYLKAP